MMKYEFDRVAVEGVIYNKIRIRNGWNINKPTMNEIYSLNNDDFLRISQKLSNAPF